MTDPAQIARSLSKAQRDALLPGARNRPILPGALLNWRTSPGHRFPSPRRSNLGYAVRAELEKMR